MHTLPYPVKLLPYPSPKQFPPYISEKMMNFEQARTNMVKQQLKTWDIFEQNLIDLFAKLPREEFVPQAYSNLAFADTSVEIGHGQVMLPPKELARMIQALAPSSDDSVLEVGTGSGYSTAILSHLAKEVTSVDIYPEFTQFATSKLNQAGCRNTKCLTGNAATGWEVGKQFDCILISGSLPILPDNFRKQLTIGGRLVAIIGSAPAMKACLYTRVAENEWTHESLFETVAPALLNAVAPNKFTF